MGFAKAEKPVVASHGDDVRVSFVENKNFQTGVVLSRDDAWSLREQLTELMDAKS